MAAAWHAFKLTPWVCIAQSVAITMSFPRRMYAFAPCVAAGSLSRQGSSFKAPPAVACSNLERLMKGLPETAQYYGQLDGIVMDLGVSSMQVCVGMHVHMQPGHTAIVNQASSQTLCGPLHLVSTVL